MPDIVLHKLNVSAIDFSEDKQFFLDPVVLVVEVVELRLPAPDLA